MSEPKPFASLGPTLLARKGAARPAMRAQFQTFGAYERHGSEQVEEGQIEDLGWNDMGHEGANDASHDSSAEDESPRRAEILALTPAPASPEPAEETSGEAEITAQAEPVHELPQVLRQQEEIARKVAQAPVHSAVEPAPRRTARGATERRKALDDGRRAAFTLRVDAERHLKLRLACTIRNLSAQQVVTEALDKLLSGIPELDSLTAQLKRK